MRHGEKTGLQPEVIGGESRGELVGHSLAVGSDRILTKPVVFYCYEEERAHCQAHGVPIRIYFAAGLQSSGTRTP
jgi:hypothetical protein